MPIGFGTTRKAARLEVEVAADMEQFDKDMNKLKQRAKDAAQKTGQAFEGMSSVVQRSLKLLSVAAIAVIADVGFRIGRDVAQGFARAFGKTTQTSVSSTIGFMRRLANTIGNALAPALALVISRLRAFGVIVGSTRGGAAGAAVFANLAQKVGAAGSVMAKFGKVVSGPVLKAVTRLSGFIGKQFFGALDVAAIGVRGLGLGLAKLGRRLQAEGRILSAFGKALTGTGTALDAFGKTLGKIIGFMVKFKIGTVLVVSGILAMSAAASGKFGNSFARVKTLLTDLNDGELRKLRTELMALQRQIGVTSEEINNTFYQTLSAMPQFAKDASSALGILEVALRVATTGFADGETAVRAITGIMNAWNLESHEAVDVADALFAAQNQGVTTFGEIAESIGSVTGLTAALGGEWRDLLSIIAVVSPFISTSEVLTGVQAVLNGVLEASPVALKEAKRIELQFNSARIAAIGVLPFIKEIIAAAEGSPDVIAKLFGRKEAQNLLINLSNQMGSLATKTDEISNAMGKLDEVTGAMEDTSERAGERLAAQWDGLLQVLGQDLERVVITTKDVAAAAIQSVTNTAAESRTILEEFFEFAGSEGADVIFDLKFGTNIKAIRQFFRDNQGAVGGLTGGLGAAAAVDLFPAFGTPSAGDDDPSKRQKLGVPPSAIPDIATLEDSQEKIQLLTARLSAQSKLAFIVTQDFEAYEAALKAAQIAVNGLAVSERNRLIAAGVARDTADQLLESVVVIGPEDDARVQEGITNIEALIVRMEQLKVLGIEAFADQRPEIADLTIEFKALDNELRQVTEDVGNLTVGDTELAAAGTTRIAQLEERIREVLAQLELFREMETIIEAVGVDLLLLGETLPADDIEIFNQAMSTFVAGLSELQLAQATYANAVGLFGEKSDEAKDALVELTDAEDAFRLVLVIVQRLLKAAGLDTVALAKAMEQLRDAAGELNPDGGEEAGAFFKWIGENAEKVEGIARGLLAVGDALDVISDGAIRALNGVVNLSTGLLQISKGNLIGGIPQAVGGVIGIVSGLFGGGESPEDKARRLAVEKNTEALRKLSNSFDAQRQAIAGVSGETLKTLREVFDFTTQPPLEGPVKSADDFARRKLQQNLDLLGLTVSEVNDMLEELGIDFRLTREDGELNADDIRAISMALDRLQLEDFFAGFTGAVDRLRREFDLMDIDEPVEKLKRWVALLREFSGLDIPDFDLNTAEGRAALEAFLIDVFTRAGEGELTVEELGKLSVQELLDLAATAESLIDAIDDPADTSFQQFRGITEITANRIQGTLTTIAFWNELTAQNVRAIVTLLGGTAIGAAGADPVPNFDPARFPGPDISPGPHEVIDQSILIESLSVIVEGTPGIDPDILADEIVRKADVLLGQTYRREIRNSGTNKITNVR